MKQKIITCKKTGEKLVVLITKTMLDNVPDTHTIQIINRYPMTDKQIRFCEEYAIDENATQAAIRAGYAKASAGTAGYKLLKNPFVGRYALELVDRRFERLNGYWHGSCFRKELKHGIEEQLKGPPPKLPDVGFQRLFGNASCYGIFEDIESYENEN
jgi:hypothetical protein